VSLEVSSSNSLILLKKLHLGTLRTLNTVKWMECIYRGKCNSARKKGAYVGIHCPTVPNCP